MAGEMPVVGVVMTMLELYRQENAARGPKFETHWKGVLEGVFTRRAKLHFAGVSYTADEVATAVGSCERADCDLVLVLPLAYAPSGIAVKALCRTKLPLLLVSTARDATLPYDMDLDHIMANHAVHGVQDLANVLGRRGHRFEMVAGHPSKPEFAASLVQAARAALGARVFRKGKVGRIGRPFAGMLDFDPGAGFSDYFGIKVVKMTARKLADAAKVIPQKRIQALANQVRKEFAVDAEATPEEMEASLRWGLALEDVVHEKGMDAVSMNFLDVAAAGAATLPFFGASRLMSVGVGYAGEGDVLTAALMASVARIAGEATFTEMFCPDYARNEILLSHMGECNFSLASRHPVRLAAKDFAFGKCLRPLVPVFQLRPGPVTLATITQWPDEGFRLVACSAEIVAAPDHANLVSPYSRIRFGRPLPEFLEAYSRAGGTHHLALGYGDLRPALQTFARFAGMGFQVA